MEAQNRPALGNLSNMQRSNSQMNQKSASVLNSQKTPLFQRNDENEGAKGKTSRTKSLFENTQSTDERRFGSTVEISEVLFLLILALRYQRP